MTIEDLRNKQLIILECISGSKAYGLDTPASDTDIKGVFILPKEHFYAMNYIPQISNETNDVVFYEFGRFMELLAQNNPNILELLNTPDSAILYKHPILNELKPAFFLSRLCCNTFGKFALSQIKKSRGLNKKIMNPIAEERKSLLDFCYVTENQGAVPLYAFLKSRGWKQEDCGLVDIPHMRDLYGLYHDPKYILNGIVKGSDSNDISLSSIPENLKPHALLYVNRDGYSSYCREYREYWEWVGKRNADRYEQTMDHGKNYDAKNMMHVFRLLEMAIEIGRDKIVNVQRPERAFLLAIKSGQFEYDELLTLAEEKKATMEMVFSNSDLPEKPDISRIRQLTYQIRNYLYNH